MLNELHTPETLRVVATYPTSPVGGGVVIYGYLAGIAEGDEDSEGYTVTRFGPCIVDLEVTDINTGGIAVGDSLFASRATPVVVSNLSTGVFLGWAAEVITSGDTDTIRVIKAGYGGNVLASGAVGTTQLANDSVTQDKLKFPIDASEQTGVATTGLITKFGTSAAPIALDTAGQIGEAAYYSTEATSDTTYGKYTRLDAKGAGAEAIAVRDKTLVKETGVGNAYGNHSTLDTDPSKGTITGQGAGLRGNLVVADRDHGSGGTYAGVIAEVYPLGNSAVAGRIACLRLNAETATAMDLKVAAMDITGADGTGKMIYTATDSTPTFVGSIKILVNGVTRYLHFANAQAAGS
jgi:hypothetical protein